MVIINFNHFVNNDTIFDYNTEVIIESPVLLQFSNDMTSLDFMLFIHTCEHSLFASMSLCVLLSYLLSTPTLVRQMEAGLSLPRGARLTHTLQSPWEIASQWVGPREVYPEETPELAAVLTSLSTARIERADVGYKGTQLKALLVLDGGQKVVFKPKRLVFAIIK